MNEIQKTYRKLHFALFVDKIEYYFLPTCFLVGICANLLSSACLLSKRDLRKRAPLFVLACIGISDSIFLSTQLQRWLAQNYNSTYINTNSFCRLYFMLSRSAIIISISLLLCLILTRLISLFKGSVYLSFYSNIGQIFSHLCVALSIAFCLSLSWHPLWTSGLLKRSDWSYDIFYRRNQSKVYHFSHPTLQCSKNLVSSRIVNALNGFYFIFGLSLSLLLIIFPLLIVLKIKKDQRDMTAFSSHERDSSDVKSVCKSFLRDSELFNPNKKRKFTWFLIFTCIFSSVFYVFFFIFDLTFYDYANSSKIVNFNLVIYNQTIKKIQNVYMEYSNKSRKNPLLNKILNENIKNEEFIIDKLYKTALTRLPLLLIIVPHVIKFYVLAFFYARFRHELSVFCCIRFYFNPSLARKVKLFGKINKIELNSVNFTSKLNSTADFKNSKDENLDSIEQITTIQAAKTVAKCKNIQLKHRCDLYCCSIAKKWLSRKKKLNSIIKITDDKENKRRRMKDILVKYDSEDETESSSIVGYKSTPINVDCRPSLF